MLRPSEMVSVGEKAHNATYVASDKRSQIMNSDS